MSATKRGRGRPPVFKGNTVKKIVAAVRKHGLMRGQEALAEAGITVSVPTMSKFATAAGVELARGRRPAA
jgi:hypothetical protein